ncbi:MAG: hypothetical protein LBI04_05145 [Treponema sp.]|jgi:hypothetical protein|nr:hypothetical protein [Treponema sp.]
MSTGADERRVLYLKRKKSGCCPRCGNKLKKTSKFIYCDDCREFFRGYNQEISATINKARKAKYDKRKKNNLCPRCGIKLSKSYDKTICPDCLEKQYEYNYGKKKKPVKSAKPAAKAKAKTKAKPKTKVKAKAKKK